MSYQIWHQPTYAEGLRTADRHKDLHRIRPARRRRRKRLPVVVLALVAGLLGPGVADVLDGSGPTTATATSADRAVH